MNDTPQAPVDPAAADTARELAQALTTRNEAEANLLNAVATGDNKLIADRGRGYVSAAREVGKLSSIVAGVPGDPTAQPPIPGQPDPATLTGSEPPPVANAGLDFEPGRAAWIVEGGSGAGYLTDEVEGIREGKVALTLTTDGVYGGAPYAAGSTLSLPQSALSLLRPEGEPAVETSQPATSPSAAEGGTAPPVSGTGAPGAETPAPADPGAKTPGDAKPQTRP